ncbi:DNA-directed RNA polymerase III subunit RPC4 [Drosophila novamexicana]|uniref:DNA-directed RNA polymerase III subunit RPC4 n=1 Tax=Drosophila novamexicana TaxID=47314 RepID=UPI0011E5F90A|nr:DNA-directed RNA polymerase III subunit RPC4 [Drosophila novamexicana]
MASGSAKRQSTMPAKRIPATAQPVAAASSNNSNAAATPVAAPLSNMSNGMSRLTPARDLTLGGRGASAAAKKVFAPNLNAVRNKNINVKTSKDFTQPRGARRGARGAGGATRGRGAGNGNSTLIQTTGVFSEGAGAVHLRKSSSGGSAYARAGDEVTISRKRKDDKSQEQRVRELIGSDDSDDGDSASDESELDKTELNFKPVMLTEGLWHTQKVNIKQETVSIPKPKPDEEDSLAVAQHLQTLHVGVQASMEEPPAQYGRYPRSIGAFLDAPQSQLFVMQLPNVLPCVADEAEDAPVATEQPASSASAEQPNSPTSTTAATGTPKPSLLAQLEEGQIGKILRYRSGRVKLLLGDTHFDLDMGLDSGFLQELMSISSNREQRSGNMINLGPIQAKLKATPDWVHLFQQQETAARQPTSATTSIPTAAGSAAT